MALTAPQVLWARRQVVADVFGAAPVTVTKAEIDSSIAALVTWIEANATSALAAMAGTPLAGASTTIKGQCLAIAIEARYSGVA